MLLPAKDEALSIFEQSYYYKQNTFFKKYGQSTSMKKNVSIVKRDAKTMKAAREEADGTLWRLKRYAVFLENLLASKRETQVDYPRICKQKSSRNLRTCCIDLMLHSSSANLPSIKKCPFHSLNQKELKGGKNSSNNLLIDIRNKIHNTISTDPPQHGVVIQAAVVLPLCSAHVDDVLCPAATSTPRRLGFLEWSASIGADCSTRREHSV
jgi:hypothetical protein